MPHLEGNWKKRRGQNSKVMREYHMVVWIFKYCWKGYLHINVLPTNILSQPLHLYPILLPGSSEPYMQDFSLFKQIQEKKGRGRTIMRNALILLAVIDGNNYRQAQKYTAFIGTLLTRLLGIPVICRISHSLPLSLRDAIWGVAEAWHEKGMNI